MKTLLLVLSVLLGGFAEFDRTVFDFGTINVKDGPQTCEFSIKNAGSEEIHIVGVSKSCSCTSVEWTTSAIKPGEDGRVRVTYSPEEGLHPFDKVLSVYIDKSERPFTLHIRGNVSNKRNK